MFNFFSWKLSYNDARYSHSLFGLGWSVVGQPSINRDTSPRFIPVFFFSSFLNKKAPSKSIERASSYAGKLTIFASAC